MSETGGVPWMTIGSLQPLPLWLIHSVTLRVVDVDDVGQAIAIHVADQDALGVVAVGEARAVPHVNALAPVAVAEVRPVLDVAVVDQDDVLQAVARHVGPLDARVGEVDVGKLLQRLALDPAGAVPALLWIVEEAFQAAAGADGVGDAVAVQVDQLDLRVFEVEARSLVDSAGTSGDPMSRRSAAESSRDIAVVTSRSMRPSPLASISCTPGSARREACRGVAHLARQVEPAATEVAPVAHRAVHLQDVGQPVAEEIDQLEVRMRQRAWRAGLGLAAGRSSRRRLKRCVTEFEWRQLLCVVAIMARHCKLAEQ